MSRSVQAATVTATWNPNPEPDIAGYKISYGTASGVYNTTLDAGNVTTFVITGLTPATRYFFVVQAYNSGGLTSPNSSEVFFDVPPALSITTLSPTSGPVAIPVTITGTNFGATQGTSTVKFNGTTATPTSWSATSIVAPVPTGATTGNVVVTVGGQPSNGSPYTVTTGPGLTSLSPFTGSVGTHVTISGVNFGATQGTSTAKFNGTTATPTSWSATSIVVSVPSGTTSGNVVVTVGGVASNGLPFAVNRPPTLNALLNRTDVSNTVVSLQLVASDPDGNALTYGAVGLPPSLTVNASTGLISGTLSSTSPGIYAVTAMVSDGNLSSSSTFTWTVTQAVAVNVAAAANGGTATASSTAGAGFAASGAIDGDHKGLNFGANGVWVDGTQSQFPDWLQVNFAGSQTIDEIDIFSIQDNAGAPIEPTLGMTFTQWGLTDFQVQSWNGSSWVAVPGGAVAGNTQVWRQLLFAPLTTSRIRILVTGAMASVSRLAEIEVYTPGAVAVPAPGAFAKTSPLNAATVTAGPVALSWLPSSGATSYEYCVDVTSNTACDGSWVSVGGQTTASIIPAANTYWWQVRARNATGTTDATGGWSTFSAIASAGQVNVAAAFNGGTATASSTAGAGFAASGAIDGDHKGLNFGANGVWVDGTQNLSPDWLQVNFAGPQTIDEIDIFSVQDNAGAPVEPTLGMTFTKWGLTDFQVQSWNGSSWVAVPGGAVAGNTQVWRQLLFAPLTTSSIRIFVTGAMAGVSRLAEIEAYTAGAVQGQLPGAFAKTSPLNAATVTAGNVALSWQASSGATSYEYCIDVTGNATCDGSWVSAGGQTTASIIAPANTYWWQARARNATGTTDATGGWSTFSATPPSGRVNVAAAANGGAAGASSTAGAGFAASGAIDGDHKGLNWGTNGGWADGTQDLFPDWLQVNFAGSQTIGEIDIFSLQDNAGAPVEPTLGMTFTKWGLTDFQVQYWNGANWVTIPGGTIAGNTQVWRQLLFTPVTTESIRILVTGAMASISRLAEIEAYTPP